MRRCAASAPTSTNSSNAWASPSCSKTPPPTCASRPRTSTRRSSCANWSRAHGCGLLLDVNNVYVSAVNHGFERARLPGAPAAGGGGRDPSRRPRPASATPMAAPC
ncbi:multinuclear nonheme iron-dependent oxidase [Bordetella pertussis]|uniref:multinuclear nonheme iron-dependent oxidase n=1 Tax=Bordetella pertussis TaxID=520 RepID=UPI00374F0D92